MENCAICQLHADPVARERFEIQRSGLWLLRHHPDPAPLPGWLLLDSLRHCAGPVDFSEEEAADWGRGVTGAAAVVLGPTAETLQRMSTDGFGSTLENRILPTGLL